MKKALLVNLLVIMLMFISCDEKTSVEKEITNVSNTISTKKETEDATEEKETEEDNNEIPQSYIYVSYSESPKIAGILNNNPIDKQYLEAWKDVVTTVDMVNMYQKNLDIWQNELEIVVDKIEKNIPKDKLKEFQKSQEAWELFYETNPNIAVDMYYFKMGTGSISHQIYGEKALWMKRYRTLELAEYCYLLTGEFEFEFEQ